MANELAVMGEDTNISLWRKPEAVLAEAKEAAQALIKVVNMKPKKVIFNGETYLEFEDWQTVSKFYGCTTKIISTNLVEYDGVRGFEATAVVLDRHQNEIGRVDSMCLSDEANWGDVPVYEWKDILDDKGQKIWVEGKDGKKRPKATKVEVRREPKPLFQLRSMAQTRAQVKALRSIFSWVVVMAGYQPTPAEELTGNEFSQDDENREEKKPPVSMPQPTKPEPVSEKMEGTIGAIKSDDQGRLWINVGGKAVGVPSVMIADKKLIVGAKVELHATKGRGEFWIADSVESVSDGFEDTIPPMPDGPAPKREPDAMDKAIAEGMFDDKPVGTLEETRTGKVGKKRQTALWASMTANKGKTGLDEKIVHKILDAMEPPVKHLEDLEIGMFEFFMRLMKGEEDWRPLLEG